MSLLMSNIPGTTKMANPIKTPIDSAKLTPKFGYLKSEMIPTRIKIAPIIVFMFCFLIVLNKI